MLKTGLRKSPIKLFLPIFLIGILFLGIYFLLRSHASLVSNCELRPVRESGYPLIKPLFMDDPCGENKKFASVQDKIDKFIDEEQRLGNLNAASVYFRRLDGEDYLSVNDDESYSPGSLLKVITLIAYLKTSEKHPEILNQKIVFQTISGIPKQTYNGPSLKVGVTYTMRDLLYFMIVYSDNSAASILFTNLDFEKFQKVFHDLNLPVPLSVHQQDYPISPSHYARFLEVLYGCTYLNADDSEYAMELLTKSTYSEGFEKIFGDKIKIARKFGERNNLGEHELHEFGVVYFNNKDYLLGVMTKGNDLNRLTTSKNKITKILYDFMSSHR